MMILLSLLVLVADASEISRCSVGPLRHNPEGYFWPLADMRGFVDSADVIVRARATRLIETERRAAGLGHRNTAVEFEPLEVLRGDSALEPLQIAGGIVQNDDFNGTAVPYRIVRMAGQRGDCFATEYRVGAEYLLILRRVNGDLTPYWAPLAPLNEQIRGRDDPWVRWVQAEMAL
jgi:hypothetical protein